MGNRVRIPSDPVTVNQRTKISESQDTSLILRIKCFRRKQFIFVAVSEVLMSQAALSP